MALPRLRRRRLRRRRNRAGARKPLTVLVAEDNEINALLTRTLLTRLGHRAGRWRESGAEALERWHDARDAGAPYDLVLMDMQMPGMDGLEAARRIRAAEAERGDRRTPIIALTANAFAEDREACLAAGMDGFLVKPLDRERLAAAMLAERRWRSAIAHASNRSLSDSLQLPQRHVLDHVALALLQDEIGALPRRQDVLVQVHEIDAVPDRGRRSRPPRRRSASNSGGSRISDRGTRCRATSGSDRRTSSCSTLSSASR